jgi:septal ring factor EnvC (AmiA/AmiB activator)
MWDDFGRNWGPWWALLLAVLLLCCLSSFASAEETYYLTETEVPELMSLNDEQLKMIEEQKADIETLEKQLNESEAEAKKSSEREKQWATYCDTLKRTNASLKTERTIFQIISGLLAAAVLVVVLTD